MERTASYRGEPRKTLFVLREGSRRHSKDLPSRIPSLAPFTDSSALFRNTKSGCPTKRSKLSSKTLIYRPPAQPASSSTNVLAGTMANPVKLKVSAPRRRPEHPITRASNNDVLCSPQNPRHPQASWKFDAGMLGNVSRQLRRDYTYPLLQKRGVGCWRQSHRDEE